MVPDLGCVDRGPGVSRRTRNLRSLLREREGIRLRSFGRKCETPCAHSATFAGREIVSLDYGSLHVCAAVYRIPAQGRLPVQLGDLSLDRRLRADRVDSFSHHPRDLLYGLLVDLARP